MNALLVTISIGLTNPTGVLFGGSMPYVESHPDLTCALVEVVSPGEETVRTMVDRAGKAVTSSFFEQKVKVLESVGANPPPTVTLITRMGRNVMWPYRMEIGRRYLLGGRLSRERLLELNSGTITVSEPAIAPDFAGVTHLSALERVGAPDEDVFRAVVRTMAQANPTLTSEIARQLMLPPAHYGSGNLSRPGAWSGQFIVEQAMQAPALPKAIMLGRLVEQYMPGIQRAFLESLSAVAEVEDLENFIAFRQMRLQSDAPQPGLTNPYVIESKPLLELALKMQCVRAKIFLIGPIWRLPIPLTSGLRLACSE
jgi:hypothetical protein